MFLLCLIYDYSSCVPKFPCGFVCLKVGYPENITDLSSYVLCFFSSLGKISQFSIIHECHEHLHKSWEPLVVGGLEHEFYLSIQLGIILIPTDFHSMIFQRGRRKTTNQILLTIINHIYICFHMLTVRYY